MRKITRRRFLEGGLVLGAATAGCGRTEVFEDEVVEEVVVPPIGLAEGGPEDDMKNPAYIPIDSTPIHVTASSSLQSNTSAGVNSIALRNPMEAPMEILEVKWQLSIQDFADDDAALLILGGIIGCKMDLGKIPLTNGFVPVWSFGRCVNSAREVVASSHDAVGIYTWRLPYPLYVPAGAVLAPTFQHRGLFPDPIAVQVSYSGRSLPKGHKPKKVRVPYVSSWVTNNFVVSASDTDASSETDLVNPFDEPMEVHALTGRALMVLSPSLDGASEIGDSYLTSEALQIKMRESSGRAVISDFAPFRTAFPWVTRAWEFGSGYWLDPKSYYLADAKFTTPDATPVTEAYLQGFIGLVGSREIA